MELADVIFMLSEGRCLGTEYSTTHSAVPPTCSKSLAGRAQVTPQMTLGNIPVPFRQGVFLVRKTRSLAFSSLPTRRSHHVHRGLDCGFVIKMAVVRRIIRKIWAENGDTVLGVGQLRVILRASKKSPASGSWRYAAFVASA